MRIRRKGARRDRIRQISSATKRTSRRKRSMQHARATEERQEEREEERDKGRGEPHKQASLSSVWWNRNPPPMYTLENRHRLYNEKLWTVRSHTRRNHRIASVPLPCHFVPQYFRFRFPLMFSMMMPVCEQGVTIQYHCTTRGAKQPPNGVLSGVGFDCLFAHLFRPFTVLQENYATRFSMFFSSNFLQYRAQELIPRPPSLQRMDY